MTQQPPDDYVWLSQEPETPSAPPQQDFHEVNVSIGLRDLSLESRENEAEADNLSRYEIVSKPTRFFKIGRIFKVLWTEPAGNISHNEETYASPTKFGEYAFTKIRHFVVVREMQDCCLCLPLNTHNRQGVSKPGVRQQDYAAVFAQGNTPVLASGEHMSRKAFPIVVENPAETIDPMSRLNFGRVYTVEHNVKVLKVGRIAQDFLPLLDEYFTQSILPTKNRSQVENAVLEPPPVPPQLQNNPPAGGSTMEAFYSVGAPGATSEHNLDNTNNREPISVDHRYFNATSAGESEPLDRSYRVRNTDWQKFFRCGKVFSTLWTESYAGYSGSGNDPSSSFVVSVQYGEKVYSKIRRFVVVRLANRSCTCLPLTSYGGRGSKKIGIDLDEHGLIYSDKDGRPTDVPGISKKPLEVKLAQGIKWTDPWYINYGKPYTVETNIKVKDVGDLRSESRRLLRKYFNETQFREDIDSDKTPEPASQDSQSAGVGQSGSLYSRWPTLFDARVGYNPNAGNSVAQSANSSTDYAIPFRPVSGQIQRPGYEQKPNPLSGYFAPGGSPIPTTASDTTSHNTSFVPPPRNVYEPVYERPSQEINVPTSRDVHPSASQATRFSVTPTIDYVYDPRGPHFGYYSSVAMGQGNDTSPNSKANTGVWGYEAYSASSPRLASGIYPPGLPNDGSIDTARQTSERRQTQELSSAGYPPPSSTARPVDASQGPLRRQNPNVYDSNQANPGYEGPVRDESCFTGRNVEDDRVTVLPTLEEVGRSRQDLPPSNSGRYSAERRERARLYAGLVPYQEDENHVLFADMVIPQALRNRRQQDYLASDSYDPTARDYRRHSIRDRLRSFDLRFGEQQFQSEDNSKRSQVQASGRTFRGSEDPRQSQRQLSSSDLRTRRRQIQNNDDAEQPQRSTRAFRASEDPRQSRRQSNSYDPLYDP